MGLQPQLLANETYTTSEVLSELHSRVLDIRSSASILQDRLKVVDPLPEFIDSADKATLVTGDKSELSKTDLSVIALTLQLNSQGKDIILISDDYRVQNVAEHLGLKYQSMGTSGIKKGFIWQTLCKSCGKKFPATYKDNSCEVCGGNLIKRVKTRKRLR